MDPQWRDYAFPFFADMSNRGRAPLETHIEASMTLRAFSTSYLVLPTPKRIFLDNQEINEIKRIFTSRLDVLNHILSVGEKHFSDTGALMQERLAEDMYPFATHKWHSYAVSLWGLPSGVRVRQLKT